MNHPTTTRQASVASLMMYERPQLAASHDRFWALIRTGLSQAGIDAPETLSQDAEEFSVWRSPHLVLSQTCGMPYRLWLHDQVSLVGTPDYGLEGCPPGYYRSALVVRADDERYGLETFKQARFAYNQAFSQSGYAAPFWQAHAMGFFFEDRIQTGGHVASATAVAEGHAAIAAIDAVTWRNIVAFDPMAQKLRVLAWTKPTPGLPLIAAKGADTETTFAVVADAISQLDDLDKHLLGIRGLVRIAKDDYLSVPNPDDTLDPPWSS